MDQKPSKRTLLSVVVAFAIFLLLVLSIVFTGNYFWTSKPTQWGQNNATKENQCSNGVCGNNQEETFCGGIAGLPCSDGYKCILDGNYPDAGGKCFKY